MMKILKWMLIVVGFLAGTRVQLIMEIININSKKKLNDLLRQYYNKVVPFTVAEDANIVTATFIIPESCFPFTGYGDEIENNYNWQSQISAPLNHIFLRLWIEDNYNIDKSSIII